MSNSPKVVVVSAPQGAGKNIHAEQLMRMFGCTTVVDEWDGVSELPDGALVLTNLPVRAV
jgi:hypothetical protein